MARFDKETVSRLWRLASPFFFSNLAWLANGLLILLVVFALLITGVNVIISYLMRDLITALILKEEKQFFVYIWRYAGAVIVATPVFVFYRYTEERLALMWRRWLSRNFIKEYLSNLSFYKLGGYEGIDNPDQRLEEDIRFFTTQSLSLFLIVLNSIVALFSFSTVLWKLNWILPLTAIGYAVCGSVITYFLGRPLIALNFTQLKKEADYRYKLIHIRENAESIAFYRGEPKEYSRVRQRLSSALRNLLKIINRNRTIALFVQPYNLLTVIIPTIIIAPSILDGSQAPGAVYQAQDAFNRVLGSLSIIIVHFGTLSAYAAVITRLGTFAEALKDTANLSDDGYRIQTKDSHRIEFDKVTIYTPRRDQILVEDLSFALNHESLLINGPSGSGKSTILRVVAGLWQTGQGTVLRPPVKDMGFIPQRPYMALGTFQNQLLYGVPLKGLTNQRIIHVIKQVELEETLKRIGGLDSKLDWTSLLSTGEMQKIAFARLLLASPSYAFLDEATTALDHESEARIYQVLQREVKTYVSVGHRSAIATHHTLLLELKGNGKWHLDRI